MRGHLTSFKQLALFPFCFILFIIVIIILLWRQNYKRNTYLAKPSKAVDDNAGHYNKINNILNFFSTFC